MALAQYELGHRLVEAGIARRGDIRLGGLAAENHLLSATDGPQDRRFTQIVTVDAHTKIDFARICICAIQAHEPENRICGQAFQALQHYISPSPRPLRGGERV